MKQLKGGAAFFILGFVLILIVVLSMAVAWAIASGITSVKLRFDIDIKVDDSGTWATSFLRTEADGPSYMEVLGSSGAENYIEKMKNRTDSINTTAIKSKKSLVVQPNIKLGQDSSSEKLTIDIPVPGGEKKSLDIRG